LIELLRAAEELVAPGQFADGHYRAVTPPFRDSVNEPLAAEALGHLAVEVIGTRATNATADCEGDPVVGPVDHYTGLISIERTTWETPQAKVLVHLLVRSGFWLRHFRLFSLVIRGVVSFLSGEMGRQRLD
jgi:hypothetical protein